MRMPLTRGADVPAGPPRPGRAGTRLCVRGWPRFVPGLALPCDGVGVLVSVGKGPSPPYHHHHCHCLPCAVRGPRHPARAPATAAVCSGGRAGARAGASSRVPPPKGALRRGPAARAGFGSRGLMERACALFPCVLILRRTREGTQCCPPPPGAFLGGASFALQTAAGAAAAQGWRRH